MARRLVDPYLTVLDSNGDPVSGALLNAYESGTTTRLDTYTDSTLTTANANPVVADSAGRFGEIWLQAQDYKIVITDSSGVTIKTIDPVQGALVISGDDFKVSQQSPADMTVQAAAGTLYDSATKARISQSVQNSGSITAPTTNPRRDIVHINARTGAIGITTGTEAASPADPTLAEGLLPLARIVLATTTTEITSAEITDIRELNNLGLINTDGGLTLYSDDAGSAKEPSLILERASASAAANDFLGSVILRGRDNAGTPAAVDYAEIIAQILDPTAASEDAAAIIRAMIAGTLTDIITAGPGVQIGSPTGGDQGAGTLNAGGVFIDGTAVLTAVPAAGVTQTSLSTTTGDLTDATTQTLQTGPGGEYGFWPTIKTSSAAITRGYLAHVGAPVDATGAASSLNIGTTLLNRIVTGISSAGTETVRQRYVQASPPYDLGDGEVPLFIFARVDAAGNILNTYVAPEPPWANNGPTNIRPDFEDRAGRKFRRRLVVPNIRAGLDGTKATRAALEAALAEPQFELVEITQAMKQADMPLIPHPWLGNDLTGQTIVLLDPIADMTHKLLMLHEQIAEANADESIGELLHDGYMKIDNAGLSRACPPGVRACAAAWK